MIKPDREPVHAGLSGSYRSQGVGSDVRTRLERAGRERLGVRLALVLGFAAVFGLWLAWGYQLLQHLEHIQHNVNDVQESYVRGEQVLVTVRTNVLLGSIYLRDALIDNESSRREYYRSELNRLRDEIEAPLNVYLRDAAPEERGQWARLETELREYWASREMAFTDDAHTPTTAYLLLRKRVVPKRDGVLQIVDQLSDLQFAARTSASRTTPTRCTESCAGAWC